MRTPSGFAFIFFITALLLTSCRIIVNARQKGNMCELHHVKMKKAIVKTNFGIYDPYYKYKNSKHLVGMGCVKNLWPAERLAKIYYCAECDRLEKGYEATRKK